MIKLFVEYQASFKHQTAVMATHVYAIAVFECVFFLLAFFEVGEGGIEGGDQGKGGVGECGCRDGWGSGVEG
jgi:hypothetical protein